MQTYFLRLRTGDVIDDDPEGTVLPDLKAARQEAIRAARELLANAITSGRDDHPDEILIFDQEDKRLSTVRLADVVPRKLRA
jgi:hypothetical protein